MKREVNNWTIEKLCKERERIDFPDYQREPNIWHKEEKVKLIDSIQRGFDIPKLYFYKVEDSNRYEVVDGQQRLWAMWGFYDGNDKNINGKVFPNLSTKEKRQFINYKLQITEITEATEAELRLLFLRLQLGKLLNSGEKLHATTGIVKNFVFTRMQRHNFINTLNIPRRRYAKETLCAQICINSYHRAKDKTFFRTRFRDLEKFFKDGEHADGKELAFFKNQFKSIISILEILDRYFNKKMHLLKMRSFVLSVYLFVEELVKDKDSEYIKEIMPIFVNFVVKFLQSLKAETKLKINRTNEDLYRFESYLSNAPGEKYQMERRHESLKEFFEYFQKHKKIKGDR